MQLHIHLEVKIYIESVYLQLAARASFGFRHPSYDYTFGTTTGMSTRTEKEARRLEIGTMRIKNHCGRSWWFKKFNTLSGSFCVLIEHGCYGTSTISQSKRRSARSAFSSGQTPIMVAYSPRSGSSKTRDTRATASSSRCIWWRCSSSRLRYFRR